jgi:cysteinyl-tRNA synthetase
MRYLGLLALLTGCAAMAPEEPKRPLEEVSSWAIQLQGLDRPGAVKRVERDEADLVVIDPTRTVRGKESFPTRDVVAWFRQKRTCLAYLNVGQAEAYRTYWRSHWRAPTAEQPGRPAYLLTVDPDGWEGNYPVAYWDLRWRGVLWGAPDAPLDQALADGFDGAYLDWILGFEDPTVVAAARAAGVDPADAMVALVRELRAYARRRNPRFLLIAQNGAALVAARPEFAKVVDGISQESLSFGGRAGAGWEQGGAGDVVPVAGSPTQERLVRCRELGLPVFTLDYATLPENVERARTLSRRLGFVPFVSRAPLDRLPTD